MNYRDAMNYVWDESVRLATEASAAYAANVHDKQYLYGKRRPDGVTFALHVKGEDADCKGLELLHGEHFTRNATTDQLAHWVRKILDSIPCLPPDDEGRPHTA